MTVEQALMMKEIMKRAYTGGFNFGLGYKPSYLLDPGKIIVVKENMGQFSVTFTELFFDHDFARAVFGDEPLRDEQKYEFHVQYWWQHRIQQLALTPPEERIKYIYAHS